MVGSLFVFLMSLAHGGEWHSIGAAPAPPYIPPYKVEYTCDMRVDHGRGRLTKTETKTVELHDAEFRQYGRAWVQFEGQSFGLSFVKGEPEDRPQVTLHLKLGKPTSSATFDGTSGRTMLTNGNRSVTVSVKCTKI